MRRVNFAVAALALLASSSASAVTITTYGFGNNNSCPPGTLNCAGIVADRVDWGELAEVEDVGTDARISASGSFFAFDVGGGNPWNQGMWIFGAPGWVEVAFSTPSDSLFVQFEADANDGLARFLIDGVDVGVLNTTNGSWFAAVFSDLSLAAHTMRVEAISTSFPRDLAIDVIGSGAPGSGPVPEPSTLLLVTTAIIGLLGGAHRRRRL